MKRTLQDYVSHSQIVGAIAVTVSLVYVGERVRQNTEAQKHRSTEAQKGVSKTKLLITHPGENMPNPPEDTDPQKWHRYFAIDNNNRAWDLAALPARTRSQEYELLNTAHAAAAHWSAVGTELNRMRARMLLAEVHALLGLGQSAFELSEAVRAYFLSRETDDWEVAFTHAIHAHAASVAGESMAHRTSYAAAVTAIETIASAEDRDIVMQTFNQVPKPDDV
jgi:hypothetical protein